MTEDEIDRMVTIADECLTIAEGEFAAEFARYANVLASAARPEQGRGLDPACRAPFADKMARLPVPLLPAALEPSFV